jgi:HEXXH motif-containing protein
MLAGKWVYGISGTKRICVLASELDQKQTAFINGIKKSSHTSYQPWMSCRDNLDYFSDLNLDLNDKIITDPKKLKTLRDGLAYRGSPLGMIGMQEENGFCIDQSPNETFTIQIQEALDLVFESSSNLKTRWETLINTVVPVTHSATPPTILGRGFSNHFFRKAIFIQLPSDSPKKNLQIALNLVHELGHQALMTYQNADLIVETNREHEVYSVIRKIKRPIIRSFHAFFVSAYMLEFLIEAQKLDLPIDLMAQIKGEASVIRGLLLTSVTELRTSPVSFSQLGSEIIDEIEKLAIFEV